jgi:nicotinamidase-related amidase
MKLGLIIIDLQKAYYEGESKTSMARACAYINAIIPAFRKKKLPILWIQHRDDDDNVVPGTPGFDFVDELKPEESDYRVVKRYGNGFNKTECMEILKKHEVDTVVITGYCAEHCVLSTYRGALDLDLNPVILRDAIASGDPKNQHFVESVSELVSYGTLRKILE